MAPTLLLYGLAAGILAVTAIAVHRVTRAGVRAPLSAMSRFDEMDELDKGPGPLPNAEPAPPAGADTP